MKRPEDMDEYERAGFDLPKEFKQKVAKFGLTPQQTIAAIRGLNVTPLHSLEVICSLNEILKENYLRERERRTKHGKNKRAFHFAMPRCK
jgi:hypothetical protein